MKVSLVEGDFQAAHVIAMTNMLPPLSAELIAEWERGCTFSTDWTTYHFLLWAELLKPLRAEPIKVLEIGSWEGRSALFFLNYLPNSQITCVDTFEGSEEHLRNVRRLEALAVLEKRFDANTNRFQSRVEKIKARSHAALIDLGIARRRFDLVYVDGSHHARDVYGDAVLSWSLLNWEGFVIFDDYNWNYIPGPTPKMAIDAFCCNFADNIVVHCGNQVIVQKVRQAKPTPIRMRVLSMLMKQAAE
jgi:predicted O-methyltransferase YrrM